MDLQALLSGAGGMGGMGGPQPGQDQKNLMDTAETIQISSLALLKMLKHGRAGVPMEVMGLMLGEFVDEYCVKVVDVFAMPQSGTGVSVEAVDPVFQTKMLDMLKQTGRTEMVVGWYHSHPGFGPWLSSVDCETQKSFEALTKRAVAVVIDPIQSVKGKVVIDAFRLISPQSMMMQVEPRQTTSNIGHLHKPSIVALIHGLNRHYYSLPIDYKKKEEEMAMLQNSNKREWIGSLEEIPTATTTSTTSRSNKNKLNNEALIKSLLSLATLYSKSLQDELVLSKEELRIRHIGKQDPKRHMADCAETMLSGNVVEVMKDQINEEIF